MHKTKLNLTRALRVYLPLLARCRYFTTTRRRSFQWVVACVKRLTSALSSSSTKLKLLIDRCEKETWRGDSKEKDDYTGEKFFDFLNSFSFYLPKWARTGAVTKFLYLNFRLNLWLKERKEQSKTFKTAGKSWASFIQSSLSWYMIILRRRGSRSFWNWRKAGSPYRQWR